MLSPEERVRILINETESIEKYLRGMPAEAWECPSACDRWTVADVVAHLTWITRNQAPRIVRGLRGDVSPDVPPRRRLEAGQFDPSELEDAAVVFRQEQGENLLSEFIKSNQALSEALAEVGPRDWSKLVYRPVGSESIQNIVDVFINELTVHGWDIRSRFDPEAKLSPECVSIVVERIAQRPKWWLFKQGTIPLHARYRFEITTPALYSVDVVITHDNQYMEVNSGNQPQVTFRVVGQTYIMMMYGRITLEEVISRGQVAVEGDQELVTAFEQSFVGG